MSFFATLKLNSTNYITVGDRVAQIPQAAQLRGLTPNVCEESTECTQHIQH